MDKRLLVTGMGKFYIRDVYTRDKAGEKITAKTSGDEMIKVVCVVTDAIGYTENVWVNFTQTWLKFLGQLMDSVGIPEGYSLEKTFADPSILAGRAGECLIDIQEHPLYGKQSKLKFIKRLEVIQNYPRENNVSPIRDDLDMDIPF